MQATSNSTRSRPELIAFRVTPGEREQLRQLSAQSGTNVSEVIRQGLATQGFRPER